MKKYVIKLSKMSGDEIRFRIKQKVRIEIEKWRSHIAPNGTASSLFVPKEAAALVSTINERIEFSGINFFCLSEIPRLLRESYERLFPTEFSQAINQADNILQHRFHFFARHFSFSDQIDWNRNPATNQPYPRRHYSTISTGNTQKYGDIKYLWELNRHQFFIELAKTYFITGDEKYAQKIREFVIGWIDSNPYKLTVNWTSALESAVRIFSWVWTFYFSRESRIWDSNFIEKFFRNLLLEGTYIEDNLSYYFSPYNHLIGELSALAFMGTVYPFSEELIIWRDKYWKELEDQVEKQFHPDGFTVEQASYYHHFTLGFYLMLAVLRRKNDLPVSSRVWLQIEKALEFSMHLTRPDGRLPMIGDMDNARSIYFYQPVDMWNLRAFLALGAVLFKRADMKYVAAGSFEEILWLLGREGVETYQRLNAKAPKELSRSFADSGYFIMRDAWKNSGNYCYLDCGEIAHGVHKDDIPSAAHGHADILSFELSVDGQPVVIDPGFHTYFGPREWHQYFRSTNGHNVVEVNGYGQATHGSPLAWSNVSSPELCHWFSSPDIDVACGWIDRFSGVEGNVFMRRFILFSKPDYFLIVDQIIEPAAKDTRFNIDSYLHFPPGDISYNSSTVLRKEKKLAVLALPQEADVNILSGGERPDQGWMAQGYGYRQAAPVMQISIQKTLPVEYGMLFPTQSGQKSLSGFTMGERSNGFLRFHVEMENRKDIVVFNPERKLFLEPNQGIRTDALIIKHYEEQEKITNLFVAQVTHLEVNGKHLKVDNPAGTGIRLWQNHSNPED